MLHYRPTVTAIIVLTFVSTTALIIPTTFFSSQLYSSTRTKATARSVLIAAAHVRDEQEVSRKPFNGSQKSERLFFGFNKVSTTEIYLLVV